MKRVSVSELKARLSRYLSMVKAGEEVLITERGKPVAHLTPLRSLELDNEEEWPRLRRMEAQGLIRIGTGKLPPGWYKSYGPPDPEGKLLTTLIKERRQGR